MFTPGLDDEVLMILPFVLIPVQMYFISSITKQTPFVVRESVSLLKLSVAQTLRPQVHPLCYIADVDAVHAGRNCHLWISRTYVF